MRQIFKGSTKKEINEMNILKKLCYSNTNKCCVRIKGISWAYNRKQTNEKYENLVDKMCFNLQQKWKEANFWLRPIAHFRSIFRNQRSNSQTTWVFLCFKISDVLKEKNQHHFLKLSQNFCRTKTKEFLAVFRVADK